MNVVSRQDALRTGLVRYFTGKPCPHGHLCERFVSTYGCVICTDDHKKRYRKEPEFREKELSYKKVYREENKDQINEYAKWYWANHSNAKDVNKKSKAKNAKRVREYNSKYWEQNKDKLSERFRKYSRENLVYFRAKGAERRARKAAGGIHTKQDIYDILTMQKGKCGYCKVDISKRYHVDHIVPLASGGMNTRDNIQCLCPTCNHRKSAKDPIDWAQEIGLLI